MVLVIILRFFIWLLSFINAEKKQYPFTEYQNFSTLRRTRSYNKESDNNGTSSSSSDNETTPKYKKSFKHNINANFNAFMTNRCEIIIKADNDLYNFRTKRPKFVLTSI